MSLWFFGWVGTLFLSSTRVIFAAAFDRVLPDRAAEVSEKRKVPFYSLILMLLPAVGLGAIYAYIDHVRHLHAGRHAGHRGDLHVQRDRGGHPAVAQAGPVAGLARQQDQGARGADRARSSGVITIGLLVFCLYEWLTNDLYGSNKRDSLFFMGAMYLLAIVIFLLARVIRRRQGIDLGLINKEIPVE